MEDIKKIMTEIEHQEETLVFDRFGAQEAWELGELIHNKNKNLNFDIRVFDTQLFHYVADGFGPNTDRWLEGKYNTVKQTKRSSLYLYCRLQLNPERTQDSYFLPSTECGARGGGFPIRVRNAGVIGALCISGAPDHIMEHSEAVDAIAKYLKVCF